MKRNPNIAFFDFDGTITTNNTLFAFLRFYAGTTKYFLLLLLLLPVFFLTALGVLHRDKSKLLLLRIFLKNEHKMDIQEAADEFAQHYLIEHIRRDIFAKIVSHLEHGDTVVVVSSSLEEWVGSWSKLAGVRYIATKLEYTQGRFSGNYDGRNCNREEKVNRILAEYDLAQFESVFVYGDSKADKAMMELAKPENREWVKS